MLNSLDIAKAPENTRMVVAMSGGVDSSVVAGLMHAQGYEVIGIRRGWRGLVDFVPDKDADNSGCVVELTEGDNARVDLGGVRKEISLALVDEVAVGDYVIVHVGYALSVLDPEEAEKTLALFAEAGVDLVAAAEGAAQ